MKAVITGANGTVGSALCRYLTAQGIEVVKWDRSAVPIDNYHAMQQFLRDEKPDTLFHLATPSQPTGRENETWFVNYEWTSELAWITRILNIRFVFTSSVMVFTDKAIGPFNICSTPDATVGYGYEKLMAERRVFYQNPKAVVARLGWQIGEPDGSNNMVDYLQREMKEHGVIRASTEWLPACAVLSDTAQILNELAQAKPGLYLVDANRRWSFYEIVTALNDLHDFGWKIQKSSHFKFDQRMIDERVKIPTLDTHLPMLGKAGVV